MRLETNRSPKLKTLHFSTRKLALEFGRELKLATSSPKVVAQGFEVRFPSDAFQIANELYEKFAPKIRDHPVNIGVFAATTLSLLAERSELVSENSLVLEAFRRSDSSLAQATASDVASYLDNFESPEQIAGVINNVKGIYHEKLYVAAENSDGDSWTASLMPETNHPGIDVELTNALTGQTVDLQLKATDSLAYVSQHIASNPDIPVVATSEVAGLAVGIQDSGFTNASLASDVENFIAESQPADAFDAGFDMAGDMFTNGLFAIAISEGMSALAAISEGEEPSIDMDRLKKAGSRAAALALVTGIFI